MSEVWNLGNRLVNQWLLRTHGKTVLVDTGYPGGDKTFCKRLRRLGLAPESVDYLLLTHAHDDHAGFVNEALAATGATLLLHEQALPTLLKGRNRFAGGCVGRAAYVACLLMKAFGKGEHRFPPLSPASLARLKVLTPEVRASLQRELGVRVVDTPGHTVDSVSLLTEDGRLFCGDAAMNGLPSHGRVTIWAEDLPAFAQSWQTMLALAPKRLYPGHGQPFAPEDLRTFAPDVARRKLYPLKDTMAKPPEA